MSIAERIRREILQLAATRFGMQLFSLFVRLIDVPISRLTRGGFIPSADGDIMPIINLTTKGAKSKLPRSTPVLCIPDGEDLILLGSNWGKPRNPGWIYNLRAYPNAQVRKGKTTQEYTAHELHGNDRATIWQKAVTFYPPYIIYEQHSGRMLPIFLLVHRDVK